MSKHRDDIPYTPEGEALDHGVAHWEAKLVRDLMEDGFSLPEIADHMELDIATVREIASAA